MTKQITYIDLGCHLGNEVAAFLDAVKGLDVDVMVYGLDANPAMIAHCRKRFAGYDQGRIILRHGAITSQTALDTLLYVDRLGGEGSSIYEGYPRTDRRNPMKVFGRRFSDWLDVDFINLEGSINIIKANIEGAELPLIMNMHKEDMFERFDMFFGSLGNWMMDMQKSHVLRPMLPTVKHVLREHGVTVEFFSCPTEYFPHEIPLFDIRGWLTKERGVVERVDYVEV